MDVRPLLPPAVAVASVILVTLSRFDETVALVAAFACLAMLGLVAIVPNRPMLLFALLPVATWVAQRPPWAGLLQAIVIAGVIIAVAGNLPNFVRGKEAWLPAGAGVVSAVFVGFIADQAGILTGTGAALGLVVLLIAFRAAMVFMSTTSPYYALAIGLCSVPQLGLTGLIIAGAETAFGMVGIGVKAQHRLALLFGAPLAMVWLFV